VFSLLYVKLPSVKIFGLLHAAAAAAACFRSLSKKYKNLAPKFHLTGLLIFITLLG
jgi:hypothetical protein